MSDSNNNKDRTIGWFYNYTPVELIEAAGFRPYRMMRAANPTEHAYRFLTGNICHNVLNILDQGIDGEYNFLSGIIAINYCDAMKRMYDAWLYYLKPTFACMIDFPKIQTSASEKFFFSELTRLKNLIQLHFNINITDENLNNSIKLYNETRSYLKRIYSLRKQSSPPITGTQTFEILKEIMTGDRREVNTKLGLLLTDLQSIGSNQYTNSPRILLGGSAINNSGVFSLIESLGAIIVSDDLDIGMKYFDFEIQEDADDPLEALAHGYFHKTASANIVDIDKRVENLISLVENYNVDGIIYQTFKFCNPHVIDLPYLSKRIKSTGIPVLFLESEHELQSDGQMRTRIEAFMELL